MGNGFPAYGRRLPIGWDFCMPRFAFVASKKKVTCLALEFSKESRGLKDWEVVE